MLVMTVVVNAFIYCWLFLVLTPTIFLTQARKYVSVLSYC